MLTIPSAGTTVSYKQIQKTHKYFVDMIERFIKEGASYIISKKCIFGKESHTETFSSEDIKY